MYCCTPNVLYNHVGGLSSTTTSVQHPLVMMQRLPQDNGASALTTHQLQVERREREIEKCRHNTTHSYRGEERESHRDNQVYAHTTHQLQVERRERVIEQSSVCAHPTPATGGEERESHRDNQVYALTTHQLQGRGERDRANQVYALPHTSYRWERVERDIEPIKCMRSPHTSYRWRGERVIEPIKCMRYHTPATGGEERET